jgi:hypothetical protein
MNSEPLPTSDHTSPQQNTCELGENANENSFELADSRATTFKRNRHSSRTRSTYQIYQKQFSTFCENNYPDLLQVTTNQDAITIDSVVRMETVTYQVVERFLCSARNAHDASKYLSFRALSTARAAIKDLYFQAKQPTPDWWDVELPALFKGMRKSQATDRQQGLEDDEAKSPLSFTLFSWLMKHLMLCVGHNRNNARNAPLHHLFTLFSWNLICRGDNTESITLNHLGWAQDALTVRFSKMKNDQSGERAAGDVKHVYANPFTPWLCPVLSLALYFVSFPRADGISLFPGGHQKERVLAAMKSSLESDEGQHMLQSVGKSAREFGNHSFRKGATTYCTSGSVGGPSSFSVLLRGGWTIGGVIARYIKQDAAGDQFVGRTVCGLNPHSAEFAAVSPHFPIVDEEITNAVQTVFPFLHSRENLREILLFCLANLVFHEQFLTSNLPSSHPYFLSPIISLSSSLKQRVTISGDSLKTTGIPPHVSILQSLQDLKHSSKDVLLGVEDILKKNGALAPHATTSRLEEMERKLLSTIERMTAVATNTEVEVHGLQQLQWHFWDGGYRRVPRDFEFPVVSVGAGFKLWFLGNGALPPFRSLEAQDLMCKSKIKTLSEWRVLYAFLVSELEKNRVAVSKGTFSFTF